MEWTLFTDRTPEKHVDFLVADDRGKIFVGYIYVTGTVFINCECHEGSCVYYPKYWMPLPKLPEE